jgi:hypothetical protein
MTVNAAESNGNIWANARYTKVFLNVGRFDDRSNRPKMVEAPFALLHLASSPTASRQVYVEPRGFGGTAGIYASSGLVYETYTSRTGMGWLDGSQMMLEPSELGNMQDNWRGLHQFGMI